MRSKGNWSVRFEHADAEIKRVLALVDFSRTTSDTSDLNTAECSSPNCLDNSRGGIPANRGRLLQCNLTMSYRQGAHSPSPYGPLANGPEGSARSDEPTNDPAETGEPVPPD